MSKIFPVIALLQLRDAGLISSLDDPLIKYAPNFFINNPFNTKRKDITFRQVAAQISGLMRNSPCIANPKNPLETCPGTTQDIFDRFFTLFCEIN